MYLILYLVENYYIMFGNNFSHATFDLRVQIIDATIVIFKVILTFLWKEIMNLGKLPLFANCDIF